MQARSGRAAMVPDLVIEQGGWEAAALEALLARACAALSDRFDLAGWEVTVLACDDARIAALNSVFRDKPQATNVLSWPSAERAAKTPGGQPPPPRPAPFGDCHLGDIALAHETCMAEARAAGLAPEAHLTHLILHGILHLLGYDHETDADAELMEGIETELLDKLGIADPYRSERAAGFAGQGRTDE